ATVTPDTVALGGTAEFTVVISGGTGRETVSPPSVNGLPLLGQRSSSEVSVVNFSANVVSRHVFTLRPARTGSFTIPALNIPSGQTVLRTAPVTLQVVPAGESTGPRDPAGARLAFMLLDLPKREFYVGESVLAEIHLFAQAGRLERPPTLAAEGFTVGRLQPSGRQLPVRTNDTLYQRVTWQAPVTAVKPGTQALTAAEARLIVPMRRPDRSGAFSDFFPNFAEQVPVELAADPVEVVVRPLPAENVPPGFSGAVGEFQAVFAGAPTNIAAGDPVTLRLEVSGHGNFDAMQMPEQPAWAAFRKYPAVARFETEDPHGLSGRKVFEQVLVPERAGMDAVPAGAFAFFSPARGRYETLALPALPLVVRPAATATGAGPRLAEAAGLPEERPARGDAPGGLAHTRTEPGRPAMISAPLLTRPWFAALLLLPAAGWAAAHAWRLRREREEADPELHRRRRAERVLDRALADLAHAARGGEAAACFAALARVLQESPGPALGVPP
ncbi:MAG TPA: BatD family protein, partial [Verrucomicrobiota bacterium]|nr:BatD family protein [Verrucomicrobiota bacterium]